MKIALGGDHAGYEYKKALIEALAAEGVETKDFGPFSTDSVDYPDYVHPLAKSVLAKEADLGILICGSANGVAITANKHAGIRAAICWKPELAELARGHNDANVVCIPARFVSLDEAKEIAKKFIASPFEGGRHANRVNKIDCV
ncbi:ribose 5-phosphate isomerase B [Solitalea longa]|uniref:Ribose 5-phosphate isomerase B n=1 Tax=Solitalea longa TaxID=2079460 RepID=A0A2S4ZZW5_9SPHI|nr:ribose 5-phosphate isomerase B [Solitalea longa]POY35834.1 ribose 5-phosphate isomerase B [Solitalea longa]